MPSVQLVSDLHLECIDDININPLDYITPKAPILIMAGDIGSLYKLPQLQNFLTKVCTHFEIVVYIPGNHEYYMIDNIPKLNFQSLEHKLEELINLIVEQRKKMRKTISSIPSKAGLSSECNIPNNVCETSSK